MESTYGDRDHRSLHETAVEGRVAIAQAIAAEAKVLVPAFAIGRTQWLLYLIAGAFKRGILPRFPIDLDSPMAIEATQIDRRNAELFDEEALAMHRSGELQAESRQLHPCPTVAESRRLLGVKGPCLIMAGAGMCTGGRILHHLRNELPHPRTTVLVVGFQSKGSLGRALVDGEPSVRIMGERVPVRASVRTMGGPSGHAGQSDLMHWFDSLAGSKPKLVLTHGEDRGRTELARRIRERHGIKAHLPDLNEVLEF